MHNPFDLRWIEVDENEGALALEFDFPGALLLALKRDRKTNLAQAYWMDEQGNILQRVEAGIA